MQWWKLCRKWNAALGFKVAQLSRSSCWCMLILFQSIWKLEVFWRYPSFKFLARDQFHSLCRRFESIYGSSATTALLICKSSIKPVRLWNHFIFHFTCIFTRLYMVLLDHYFNVVVSFRFSCETTSCHCTLTIFCISLARSLGGSFTNMARNARACLDTGNSKQTHDYSKVWQFWKVPTCPCSMQLCQKHLNTVDVPVTWFDKCAAAFPDLLWRSQETSREPMRTSVKKSTQYSILGCRYLVRRSNSAISALAQTIWNCRAKTRK